MYLCMYIYDLAVSTRHRRAVREIYNGKKVSCWMWFCFPTAPYMVDGVEQGRRFCF